ncbi:hypothetical protein FB567DRAFT_605020 [Paraphoma chrysanthemicola]|uniref:Uncharacterized protein n=1 Tax=Paraphoma chrysanthemicola TaxID=798071 RepID=A0A8K0R4T2_9PLEO|nr:hypothetical protein FB567DRAFT_605020 [Paraphoma chrysanthemicola]
MPFVPTEYAFPKLPKALLRSLDPFAGETQFWEDVRDNVAPWDEDDCPPDLTPIRKGHGYEVRAYYKSTSGDVEVFPGAQGQIIQVPKPSEKNRVGYVKIHLPEIDKERVVPMAIIRAGNVHIRDRECRVGSILGQGVIAKGILSLDHRDATDPLSIAIKGFITTLAASNLPELNADFLHVVGGKEARNATQLTKLFVDGVRRAGMFDILNEPNFTYHGIEEDGIEVTGTDNSGQGIYIKIVYRNDGTIEAYVGRTSKFGRRWRDTYQEMKDPKITRPHVRACRDASGIRMFELCSLNEDIGVNLSRLGEQIFVSLLETYLPELLVAGQEWENDIMTEAFSTRNPDAPQTKSLEDRMSAVRLHSIAKAAKKETNWPGFARRESSGVSGGHNIESPLMEWLSGLQYERYLWIRRDTCIPDEDNSTDRIPVAVFRRTIPLKVHWITRKNTKLTSGQQLSWSGLPLPRVIVKPDQEAVGYRIKLSELSLTDGSTPDGETLPRQGTSVQVVFEVRLDGKPHPFAWAALPLIGAFEDWQHAMSWAHRMEWKSPSGVWRRHYLQKSDSVLEEKGSRGSLRVYMVGMMVVRWLLRQLPDQWTLNRKWMYSLPPMHVLQIQIDYLKQRISLREPVPVPAKYSSARLSDASLMQIMSDPAWMFGRLGITPKQIQKTDTTLNLTTKTLNKIFSGAYRKICDTCTAHANWSSKCKPVPGKPVCVQCYEVFGRPTCTFTVGMYGTEVAMSNAASTDSRLRQVQQLNRWALDSVAYGDKLGRGTGLGTDPQFQRVTVDFEGTVDLQDDGDDDDAED